MTNLTLDQNVILVNVQNPTLTKPGRITQVEDGRIIVDADKLMWPRRIRKPLEIFADWEFTAIGATANQDDHTGDWKLVAPVTKEQWSEANNVWDTFLWELKQKGWKHPAEMVI
jgi:hypothetical protein